jgi:tetratricopeptide (TPR) repeat protein
LSGVRTPLLALAVALVALLALAAQVVADGLYGTAAVPGSVPRALAGDWPFAFAARTGLDRIPAVRIELARGAILRREPERVGALLGGLPATPDVYDLRSRAELMTDDASAALRDFAEAGDFIAAQAAIDALGSHDPKAALAIVRDFEQRLAQHGASPEIGAEVEFREGGIAASAAARYPAEADAYYRASLDAFARALERAPNEEKYLLNYAGIALRVGDVEAARRTYARAAEVVPDSVDAFTGLAFATAALGRCGPARAALAQAQRFALQQHRSVDVAGNGYAADVRAPLARCIE